MPRQAVWLILGILLVPLAGCVKKSTHEVTLAELADARAEGEELRDRVEHLDAELERELREIQVRETALNRRIGEL
ncbi:MAG: hypothetical protein LC667_09135, partial [Thioalkalivibrio sp.]|nr:hypothetical protein [Thioalkalivibrio sp.]